MGEDVIALWEETAVSPQGWGGSYVLRLQVHTDLSVSFGRFRGGEPIAVPVGSYVYVGSALRGLGTRLLRHAARSESAPQAIYPLLHRQLQVWGALSPGWQPRRKTVRWHVDYLLQETAVSLTHVLALRSQRPLETQVARLLLADAAIRPLAPGLGASDDPGQTHLLRIPDGLDCWHRLSAVIIANLQG